MADFVAGSDKTAVKMARNLREYCLSSGCMYCPFCKSTIGGTVCRIGNPRDFWYLEEIKTEDGNK